MHVHPLIFYDFSVISNAFITIYESTKIICISERRIKVLCLNIQLVPSLKVSNELLLRYEYFVETSPLFRSALALPWKPCNMNLFFRARFLPIKVVSQNNLTHIRSVPDGARFVYLDPKVLRMCMLFIYKMYHIFGYGHYGIFVQNKTTC